MKNKFPVIIEHILKFHNKYKTCCLGKKIWDDLIAREAIVDFAYKYQRVNGKPPREDCDVILGHFLFGTPLKYKFDFPLDIEDPNFLNLIKLQQRKNDGIQSVEKVYETWH